MATTGLLACAFYVYVLCQWMRDTNGRRTLRRVVDRGIKDEKEMQRPYIVGSRKIGESQNQSSVRPHGVPKVAKSSVDRESEWSATERMAYQRIAGSLSLRKRI